MCFSAAANFVGSGVLGVIGVATLTNVKHRRELLFAGLPTLFAVHQFMEGFVWLGLDGKRYAFTSLWCAYAAIASIIILAYFWKTTAHWPLKYLQPLWSTIL